MAKAVIRWQLNDLCPLIVVLPDKEPQKLIRSWGYRTGEQQGHHRQEVQRG